MRREEWQVWAPTFGTAGHVVAYGHWGRPILYYPCEGGGAYDVENHGIIHVLAPAIEAGRIKVYTVDANDHWSWSNQAIPCEERARRHNAYFAWITDEVVPAIHRDCGGRAPITTTGMSMGAFHAVNSALRRADLFPHAVGMSGNYDPSTWHPWGEMGDALYFNNPLAFVPNLHGDQLDWLRSHVFIQLVVGTGQWEEHPTRALPSSRALAGALWDKAIPCDLDVWGTDTPHDWPSWERMAVKHLASLS
jgi:esterase/lipase superfamily enzyme